MPKPLFHSLGSNYSSDLVAIANQYTDDPLRHQDEQSKQLLEALETRFSGTGMLVYKGRDAIELALRPIAQSLSRTGKQLGVLTQGLACHAIEEGIVRAGLFPIYADLAEGSLGPSIETLKAALERAKESSIEVKVVFLQHLLGYVNDVQAISEFCKKHQLILIEDLAQSFGASDAQHRQVGTLADVIIFSFGRDKVLDGVSGGAVLFKQSFWKQVNLDAEWVKIHLPTEFPPQNVVKKELFYPSLTQFIRQTHQVLVGKVVFKIARMFGFLTSPIAAAVAYPTLLPAGYVSLVLWQLKHLDVQLTHRRELATFYLHELQSIPEVKSYLAEDRIAHDVHLRVPVLMDSATSLQKFLANCTAENIHITDRWYRDVVDSGSLRYPTLYKAGTCPVAESTAERLLNLPTHQYITRQDAKRIMTILRSTQGEA